MERGQKNTVTIERLREEWERWIVGVGENAEKQEKIVKIEPTFKVL